MLEKKMKKKLLTLILIITLVFTSVGVISFAQTDDIESMISEMSLRDKITQMFMMEFRQWGDENLTKMNNQVKKIVTDYNFGAIIFFANNIKETEDTYKLTQDFQQAAITDGGIPMIIATDQEGGMVFRLGSGTALPGNMALAATGDKNNAYKAGCIIGSELASLGINTTLAPVIDINNNPNNTVIGLRSFSDKADIVGNYGAKMIEGINKYNVIAVSYTHLTLPTKSLV